MVGLGIFISGSEKYLERKGATSRRVTLGPVRQRGDSIEEITCDSVPTAWPPPATPSTVPHHCPITNGLFLLFLNK